MGMSTSKVYVGRTIFRGDMGRANMSSVLLGSALIFCLFVLTFGLGLSPCFGLPLPLLRSPTDQYQNR